MSPAAHHRQPEAVALRRREAQLRLPAGCAQSAQATLAAACITASLPQLGPEMTSGRSARSERSGDDVRPGRRTSVGKIREPAARCGSMSVGDGKSQPRQVVRRGADTSAWRRRRAGSPRARQMNSGAFARRWSARVAHGGVVPTRDVQRRGVLDRLAAAPTAAARRPSIGAMFVTSSPRTSTASASGHVAGATACAPGLRASMSRAVAMRPRSFSDQPAIEALRPDQRPQGEVRFQRRPRRADADHALPAAAKDLAERTAARSRRVDRLCVPPAASRRSGRRMRLGGVDELVAEAAAVAEEIAVHLAVDSGCGCAAACRSARRESCCSRGRSGRRPRARSAGPICGCSARLSVLSVKTPVGQTSTRLPLNSLSSAPSSVPAEIDVVVPAEDVEVAAAGIVAVEPHAAVALDAAVHLVVDERAQVLVAVRALLEADSGDRHGRSSRSCPGDGIRRLRRRPGSRADG